MEFGWLSLHSPHGFRSFRQDFKSAAHAWYSIIHRINDVDFSKGRYKTTDCFVSSSDKHKHLLDILRLKTQYHPILKQYLLDTNNRKIVYSISKYASIDESWLGYCFSTEEGHNELGKAWMEIRLELILTKELRVLPDE